MLKSKFIFKSNTGIIAHLVTDDTIIPYEMGVACSKLCNFNRESKIRRDPRYVGKICHIVALEDAGYYESAPDCDYLEEPYGIIKLYSSPNLFLVSWIKNNEIQIT